jgi:hypothetical protein
MRVGVRQRPLQALQLQGRNSSMLAFSIGSSAKVLVLAFMPASPVFVVVESPGP